MEVFGIELTRLNPYECDPQNIINTQQYKSNLESTRIPIIFFDYFN